MGTWLHDVGHGAATGALAGAVPMAGLAAIGRKPDRPLNRYDAMVPAAAALAGGVVGAGYGAAHHLVHSHDHEEKAAATTSGARPSSSDHMLRGAGIGAGIGGALGAAVPYVLGARQTAPRFTAAENRRLAAQFGGVGAGLGAGLGATGGLAYHRATRPAFAPAPPDTRPDDYHAEKTSFLNTAMGAAKAIGSNVVKPLQNSVVGRALGSGLGTLGKGYNALGALKAMPKAIGGSLSMSSNQPGFKPQQSMKTSASSPSETPHPVFVRAAYHLLLKRAYHPSWHRPVNALSYAAFAAPYVSQTVHDNARLATALNAAGLVGLGATSADSVAHGDDLAAYDLAGLGVMGAGMLHSAHRAATATPHP